MTRTTFKTAIKGFGNNTGIEVPEEALEELGSGKRAPVNVSIGSYSYKSTVGVMNGMFLISLPKAHREAAGLKAGDKITVTLELDEGIREVEVPKSLQTALVSAKLDQVFSKLAYSKRKEFARQINEAKTDETRDRRIAKVIEAVKQ
jgi:bifunctional DNA-binding transcriptional regulator/antitoxin component of YhaV-PrlF toxin-antitoxin module